MPESLKALTQVLSYEFCQISKNTFLHRTPLSYNNNQAYFQDPSYNNKKAYFQDPLEQF